MEAERNATREGLNGFVAGVRRIIGERLERIAADVRLAVSPEQLMPGKMLRTRLAARLLASGSVPADSPTVARACAATELVHTASLCHDDVIDNAVIRRFKPTLWRAASPSGAVLIGDLLLCDAIDLILETRDGRYARPFVAKVREVCSAEAEQELALRGRRVDEDTCLRIARGKAGPLFAFVAYMCGGDDRALAAALEEAGYRIGASYQLADDLLDIVGGEETAGKTLHTDVARRKFTLPQVSQDRPATTRGRIARLCASAHEGLADWPEVRAALASFFHDDLRPALTALHQPTALCLEIST